MINGTTLKASASSSHSTQARVSNNRDLCDVEGQLHVFPLIASQNLELSLKGQVEGGTQGKILCFIGDSILV